MPRDKRINVHGGVYHVIARGIGNSGDTMHNSELSMMSLEFRILLISHPFSAIM